jgi:hypothetical protein
MHHPHRPIDKKDLRNNNKCFTHEGNKRINQKASFVHGND